jgi:hypothetical protein
MYLLSFFCIPVRLTSFCMKRGAEPVRCRHNRKLPKSHLDMCVLSLIALS